MENIISETAIKGGIAQAKVEQRALEKGFLVSKPIIEQSRYDLIIDNGDELKRLQIKYCGKEQNSSKGSVCVDLRKQALNGKVTKGYKKSEVDAIVVYIPQIDKVCYFPIDMVDRKSTITIRYKRSANNQQKRVIYADDYIW